MRHSVIPSLGILSLSTILLFVNFTSSLVLAPECLAPKRSGLARHSTPKIEIPHTAWCPVEVVEVFGSDPERQTDDDVQRGFFKRGAQGELLAPVVRDPTRNHPMDSIHGRSVASDVPLSELAVGIWTRVVKGAGLAQPIRGIPFDFDPEEKIETRRFKGGETKKFARYSAQAALAIRRAYQQALKEDDPVAIVASHQYGIKEAPVLRPLYLLRPLKIPIEKEGRLQWIDPTEALNEVGVPSQVIKEQMIFVYEVPLMERVVELGQQTDVSSSLRGKIDSAYATQESSKILKQFAARLALGIHLTHRRLGWSLSGRIGSALGSGNITLTGHIVDLDPVNQAPSVEEFILDRWLARLAISIFAADMELSEEIGLDAFNEVFFAELPTNISDEFRQAYYAWFDFLWAGRKESPFSLHPLARATPGVDLYLKPLAKAAKIIKQGLAKGKFVEEIADKIRPFLEEAALSRGSVYIPPNEKEKEDFTRQQAKELQTLAGQSHLLVELIANELNYGKSKTPEKRDNHQRTEQAI